MTDLSAGTIVTALDFPPTVQANDGTSQINISSTAYITGSPVVSTTFTAPTSGRVRLIASFVGGADASGNRAFVSPQVFEGTDTTGTEVLSPSVATAVGSMGEQTSSSAYERCSFLDGLTPGGTYFVRVMYRVTGGTTLDLLYRGIIVVPLT